MKLHSSKTGLAAAFVYLTLVLWIFKIGEACMARDPGSTWDCSLLLQLITLPLGFILTIAPGDPQGKLMNALIAGLIYAGLIYIVPTLIANIRRENRDIS